MPAKPHLKLAVSEQPHTKRLIDGSIPIEGVDAEFVVVKPQIAAFRRMVRDLEFDVCELASTTYIIARAYNSPLVALPIFTARRFHHAGLLVRPDAQIHHPKDLEGKKVGVRAYSVTTGVWNRAILADEFGLDHSKVTWVVDDEEHVRQMRLPANVISAPAGISLAEMMARGELSAGLAASAGIGRSGSPTAGWKTVEADYPDLFPNANELEADWYARTGIYPIHGTIVVKEDVLVEHPWVGQALFNAFSQAKAEWLARLDDGDAEEKVDKKYAAFRRIVGQDPLPYGLEPNLPTIRALEFAAFSQKLTPRRISVDELFFNPERT